MKNAKLGINAVVSIFLTFCFALGFYSVGSSETFGKDIVEESAGYSVVSTSPVESNANNNLVTIIHDKAGINKADGRKYLLISGMPFGIKLFINGVAVVGTESILSDDGYVNPGELAGLKEGDIITHVNGVKITKNVELSEQLSENSGETVLFTVDRNNTVHNLSFTPVLSAEDKMYKAGLWVRDSTSGIGTLSFYDEYSDMFCGLGHGVSDADTGEIVAMNDGEAYTAHIIGAKPGTQTQIGELSGVFTDVLLGDVVINSNTGVYGIRNKNTEPESNLIPEKPLVYPLSLSSEVKTGKAQILSTVDDGAAQFYDIEITEIRKDTIGGKNLVINVTDADLISKTGGIVQGMSGSPIIQNGFFVGAVTHVFVDNPRGGYGIFAQTMYDEMTAFSLGLNQNAA